MTHYFRLFFYKSVTHQKSRASQVSLLVLVCFLSFNTNIVTASNDVVDPGAKSIRKRLADNDAKIRREALNDLGNAARGYSRKNGIVKQKKTVDIAYGNLVIQQLVASHQDVREGAYLVLNTISYMNYIRKFSKSGKPALDLSKNVQLRKLLLKVITERKESEKTRGLAIFIYCVNFPYNAEAKKKVIGQYWKADSLVIKGGIIGAINVWELLKSEEGQKVLLAGIKDSDTEVRIMAIRVISRRGGDENQILLEVFLKPLIDRLDMRDYTIRELSFITYAVSMYGEKAKPYQDVLIATQKELEENRFAIENILKNLKKKDVAPSKKQKSK